MKILYIIHSCIMGGATISFLNLVKGIRVNGNEVVVVHPKIKDAEVSLIEDLEVIGIKCYETDVISSYNRRGKSFIRFLIRPPIIYLKKLRFYQQLKQIIRIERSDIIHTNTGVIHEGFLLAKKYHIPHIWHLREYQTKDFHWSPLPSLKNFKKKLRSSCTVCITKDIQRYFELEQNPKSFVVYNPVLPMQEFDSADYAGNYFLIANRVSPEKGIEDVVMAFSWFCKKQPDYKLKIAGFGNITYINEIEKKCTLLQITDKVEFLGYVDNVKDLMLHAKAVIVASYSEGFGRMTAEANMLGVPVIGRNTAGTKEILDQTYGGFQFGTVTELAEKMKVVAEMNEIQICEFMKEPKKRAKKLFSTENHVKQMVQLYDKVTGGGYFCRVVLFANLPKVA